jgi:WD40 repeat protein
MCGAGEIRRKDHRRPNPTGICQMKRRTSFITITIFVTVLLACQVLAHPATPTSAPSPTQTLTPTFTPLPTFTPTNTPTTTPLPAPDTLSSQAAELCEAARTKPVLNKPFESPVMAMLKITYADQPDWDYLSLIPYFTAQSASEVKNIFCVEETRSQTASYSDGEPAYRRNWSVRVVALGSGDILGSKSFHGAEASYFKDHAGPGYGSAPTREVFAWAMGSLHDKSVFFVEEAVSTLAFLPDGIHVAAGTTYRLNVTYSGTIFNAKIFILDTSTGEVVRKLSGHTRPIDVMAVSPDGHLLASSSFTDYKAMQSLVKIWDLESGRELYSLKTSTGVRGLAFSPDNQRLAISEFEKISLVDTTNGKIANTVEPGGWKLFFTPDNLLAVNGYAGENTQFNFVDPANGELIDSLSHLCFQAASPNGDRMAMCNSDGSTSIVSTDAEHSITTVPIEASNFVAALSSNGLFAAALGNNDVQVWDISASNMIFHFSASPTALAFSPDGRLIASGAGDGFIKIWEIPTP